jgi:hypothetical protein
MDNVEVFAIGVEKETGNDMLLGDDCLFVSVHVVTQLFRGSQKV